MPAGFRMPAALAVCMMLHGGSAFAQTVVKAPERGIFHADGILQVGGELIFRGPGRETRVDVSEWDAQWSPVGGHLTLFKNQQDGRRFRFLDQQGKTSGELLIPLGRSGITHGEGLMTLPKSDHKAIVAHELKFYSLQGELLGHASEPEFVLVKVWPLAGGGVATAGYVPGKTDGVVMVYAADGSVRWRYRWAGLDARAGPPEVAVTPDNRRLALLQQELVTGPDSFGTISHLTLLKREGGKVATHSLPAMNAVFASPDSSKVVAVGQGTVVVLDASNGNLLWRRDERIDLVVRGGLRFDPAGEHLLIVALDRDQGAAVAHLGIFRFRLGDGMMERVQISDEPLDTNYTVTDVTIGDNGARRVILYDREIGVAAGDWKTP